GGRVRHGAHPRRLERGRHRSLDPPPGEHPDHRSHGETRRRADGQGLRERGPLRQHVGSLRGDRARRGGAVRSRPTRDEADVLRVRRGIHVGEYGRAVVAATVWLCPGQGAQKVGMGKDLAERFPAARDTFQAIDQALGFGLSRLMFEGPEEELTATHNAQPAILAHSAAVFAVVGAAVNGGAVAAAGHSLGEYSAYLTAGALAPTDAAALVRRRGELMHTAGTERPGTMAAILGLPTAEVEAACREASRDGLVAVAANLNAPDQTVISGDPPAVAAAGEG